MHRLTRISLAHPWTALLILGAITIGLAAGLPRVRKEFGYRVLIGDDHPTIQTLDHFIDQFGGGLPIWIVWECGTSQPCESVFDADSLVMAHSVTEVLAGEPGVRNVYGPSNASVMVPTPEGFTVRRFVEGGVPVTDADVLRQRVLEDPLWDGVFFADGGRVGAIIVQPEDNGGETSLAVYEAVEDVLVPFQEAGFVFRLAGEGASSIPPGRDLARSSARLVPVTVLVIGMVLLALSRSWVHSVAALVSMGVALVWTLGLVGWVGWPRDAITEVLAPLILVVGVCDAVHLLTAFEEKLHRAASISRKEALLEAAKDVGGPCLLTTLTTAGAFLSFLTSPLDTFLRFGITSAFGVSACLVLSFSLLPLLVVRTSAGSRERRVAETWESVLTAVVRASEHRATLVLACSGVLFAICCIGWTKLRVDTNWLESLGDESARVQWTRFVEEHLRHSETVEIELALSSGWRAEDPRTLGRIERLAGAARDLDRFEGARSAVDLVKWVNRLVHEDEPGFERLAATPAANAELIELIRLEDPETIGRWISLDGSHLRISVEAREGSFSERKRGVAEVMALIDTHIPDDWGVRLSGKYVTQLEWMQDVQSTQLRSFPVAFVLVGAMVAAFLGSLRLGLAAMVPTLLPVAVVLGTMGWMGMSLDIGRAMIAAVVIGVGVDDSIHLLDQFKRRQDAGRSAGHAIREAVLSVGPAVVTTSAALSLGFLTLMASAWQTIASFGFLVSLSIAGALLATLFVLPALIFVLARERGDLS